MTLAWQASRAGARAGAGFRFQDAATVFVLTAIWHGEIAANSVTPESLDDIGVEGAAGANWIQAKSKIDPKAQFRAKEIADIILSGKGADEDRRTIFLDRPFLDIENRDWQRRIADLPQLANALLDAVADEPARQSLMRARLERTTLITVLAPLRDAEALIANKCGIGIAGAALCARSLLHQVGVTASENARRAYNARASITVGDVHAVFSRALNLIDSEAVDGAFRQGLAQFIDFHTPVHDQHYYEGVSTRSGHVAAGLVQPRPEDVDAVVRPLLLGRHVLVAGPSGSGKSALCYLAAFETRHALRWIEAARMAESDRATLLRSIRSQAPTADRPLVVYVDDVGRGADTTWAWLVDQARYLPGLRVVGSIREEDVGVLAALDHVTIERPKLLEELAERIWTRLREAKATSRGHWKEAYEQSGGLLLEFTHILTQGARLRDVIFEQVQRRVREGRRHELAVLPIAAVAGMYGARIERPSLLETSGLSETEFAIAFLRLRNEHLVGADEGGAIRGLHDLRSREILHGRIGKYVYSFRAEPFLSLASG